MRKCLGGERSAAGLHFVGVIIIVESPCLVGVLKLSLVPGTRFVGVVKPPLALLVDSGENGSEESLCEELPEDRESLLDKLSSRGRVLKRLRRGGVLSSWAIVAMISTADLLGVSTNLLGVLSP